MAQRRSSKPIPPRGPLFGWSHPGETVAEEMATRGLTAAGFAAELGCPMAEAMRRYDEGQRTQRAEAEAHARAVLSQCEQAGTPLLPKLAREQMQP